MNKIIAFGKREDGCIWFGRPTLRSLIRAMFFHGSMLKVKPIKGYEKYAYYTHGLNISLEFVHLTNTEIGKSPLDKALFAMRHVENLTMYENCGRLG